jgi:hypothetical protein
VASSGSGRVTQVMMKKRKKLTRRKGFSARWCLTMKKTLERGKRNLWFWSRLLRNLKNLTYHLGLIKCNLQLSLDWPVAHIFKVGYIYSIVL